MIGRLVQKRNRNRICGSLAFNFHPIQYLGPWAGFFGCEAVEQFVNFSELFLNLRAGGGGRKVV